jgi:hypothetical protein
MEQFEIPHADAYVGRHIPKQLHKEAAAWFEKYWREHGTKEIEDIELKKTPRHQEIIDIAAHAVDAYLVEYGRKKIIAVPAEKIHLLRQGGVSEYTQGRLANGVHAGLFGSILTDIGSNDIQTALHVFHELFHTKSFQVLQTTGKHGGNGDIAVYRTGFMVSSRDGKRKYFDSIEEVITAYMERKFYRDILFTHPAFQNDVANNIVPEFSRPEELQDLHDLVTDLYEQNKTEFASEDEVMRLFIEAEATGHLLRVARLVEKTYGKGSFRELGGVTGVTKK